MKSGSSVETDDVVVTGVRVTEESETESSGKTETIYQYGADGYVLEITGNKLIQSGNGSKIAESVGKKLTGLQFRPLNVICQSDPSTEAGDIGLVIDRKNNMLTTVYDGPSNVKLQCFAEKKISMKEKEGWRSTAYRLRVPRTTVSFDIDKKDSDAVRYITILYPSKNTASFPIFKAKFLNKAFDENGVKIEISVGGKKRQLEYKL